MSQVSWLQVLIGFAGGSVVSALITLAIGWWWRPILQSQIIPDAGCYVEARRSNPATHTAKVGSQEYRYVRCERFDRGRQRSAIFEKDRA
jgi:hypothetical protein